jgi:alpha-D-xyloside xylohydrolase
MPQCLLRIRRVFLIILAFLTSLQLHAQWTTPNPVIDFTRQADGVVVKQKDGVLHIQVCSGSILRVTYSPLQPAPPHPPDDVVTKKGWIPASFKVDEDDKQISIAVASGKAVITRENGAITYFSASGERLTNDSYRSLRPVTVNGEQTYHAETSFAIYGSHEGLYGLGQHQAGVWNYRGETVELSQENTNIAIPLLLSSNGYGIFLNNSSRSKVDNRFIHYLYISSEVADNIDYYFLFGPDFDRIIASYHELTGGVPMFGRWAYGFWQCKNRYASQKEILGVAAGYRDRHIPIDNIVQDWFWWKTMGDPTFNENYPDPDGMVSTLHNEHVHLMLSVWPFFRAPSAEYDYMDKQGWFIAKTVSPSFHPVGQALYDPTNPAARAYFWDLMNKNLLSKGVDAWWLDTDEPETEGREDNILTTSQVHLGSGARYANIFPLEHTRAVYEGQRAATSDKRVFILSRSAYAGAQRYSIVAWSGDVLSDFTTFKRQIPAALNYSASGMPYWTSDVGGFTSGGNLDDPKFRELFIRWFQFGAFSPIFRIHGTRNPNENELWSYGPDAQKILVNYDNLRYRLMPYIYSLAWMTTSKNYTMMRPLVMDWRTDVKAQNTGDEYLFGPAILVAPVSDQGATSRRVYLPAARWYDFWTGESVDTTAEGGREIEASAPLEKMPLYVRAGSILPLGPELQYSTEKPEDPIELRVFAGADGDFLFYEDENDGYNYEKGSFATIAFHWDDASHTLTIGDRSGSFPGVLQSRTFHVVFVSPGKGTGIAAASSVDKTVTYTGKSITVVR